MKTANIRRTTAWFEVQLTTKRSQTAVMTLDAGGESSEELNTHEHSDQVVLVIEGEIAAEVGGKKMTLRGGDSAIIPAGTPHRLSNGGKTKAVTFNVYSPPEYPPGTKD